MSKKIPDEYISQLSSKLSDECVESIELDETSELSSERIRQLAMEKRENSKRGEGVKVKSRFLKLAAVVALIFVLGVTVYEAGGFDYIINEFTGDTNYIREAIDEPKLSETINGKTFTVESILTDGFNTHLVVSLDGAGENDYYYGLFDNLSLATLGLKHPLTFGIRPIEELSTKIKLYYSVYIHSGNNLDGDNIVLKINENIAPISINVPIEKNVRIIKFDLEDTLVLNYLKLKKFEITPLGFYFEAETDDLNEKEEFLKIDLNYSNGDIETIEVPLVYDRISAKATNTIYKDFEKVPLYIDYNGRYTETGKMIIYAGISKIINVNEIEKIVIEGVEYFPN